MRRVAADGMIAGAVGSVALNMVSYLDMVLRGRPASSTPDETAGRLAGAAHVDLGGGEPAANRRAGLGPLLGYGLGVGVGALYAVAAHRRPLTPPVAVGLLGATVMAMSDATMTALRVTDPRRWSRADWVADIVPHLAYGVAAAATWYRLRPPCRC
ncbi:hypothetical protein CA850_31765 [Micromonospora echinospora]|uniref:Uncharacterized protein n=1 Tax=Micromonospora echinospora TaxID=1877 RepID=A0A1C4ZFF7_MICEC|nr:hypothetical protein [Micromonospora echinospora]OZV72954.1 hypothetical protein CA850_31765 [Micromonospora echinospora]SCF31546.1 hypothetical protein GA0070618_5161 [Micromonospora echinospora]